MIKKYNFLKVLEKNLEIISKFISVILIATALLFPFQILEAAGSLTTVKDVLSTSRPSVVTTASAITLGDTTLTVASSVGIQPGDIITICTSTVSCAATETKTVATVPDATHITLTAGAGAGYAGTPGVMLKMTAVHTISFTTRSVVASGSLFISLTSGGSATDNIPDSAGFDFNRISTTTDISVTGFTPGVISTSTGASLINFSIPFSTSLASGTTVTIVIGATNRLLNPTKTAASGTADVWKAIVAERDAVPNIIDSSTIYVTTIESVLVTATVSPSLTFTIAGIGSGGTAFGATTTSVTTTTVTVPFGTLTPVINSYAAQLLTVGTNASNGYTVTGYEDASMRKTNGTTIPDYSTTAAENIATNGFGWTPVSVSGSPTLPFTYNTGAHFFHSSGFGTSTSVSTIFSNSGPTTSDQVRVIYGIRVSASQAPGDYQNLVTYIATGSF